MERPTSALHLTRVTLSLRELGAEPHTKEVGRDEVYNHHRFRSARGHDGGGGAIAGAAHPGAALDDFGQSHDSAIRHPAGSPGPGPLLLRSRPMRLRAA